MTLQDPRINPEHMPDPTQVLTDEQDAKRKELRELREQREAAERLEKNKKKAKKIGVIAGALLLAGGGATTAAIVANQAPTTVEGEAPGNPDDILDNPVIGEGEENDSEQTPTVETVLAPISPETADSELANSWLTIMNTGMMAGCNQETFDRGIASGLGVETFLDQESEANGIALANALFGPGWESDTGIHDYIYNTIIPKNRDNMQNWFTSTGNDVRYDSYWTIVDQAVTSSDGAVVEAAVTIQQFNNATESGIAEDDPDLAAASGRIFEARLVFDRTSTGVYEKKFSIKG